MCQTIAQVLTPRIDGLYSIVLILGVVYGAILLFQLLLGAGLLAIALQRLGARLVRRVRAAFARPSTTPGAAVGVGSKP